MSRLLLVWSLLFGLAVAAADWYLEQDGPQTAPSYEGGTPIDADSGEVRMMEGGTPPPPRPK